MIKQHNQKPDISFTLELWPLLLSSLAFLRLSAAVWEIGRAATHEYC